MARTDKLYARLDRLEKKMLDMLLIEFEAEFSEYLTRKKSKLHQGKTRVYNEVAELEEVEKEILMLREKLQEPAAGTTLGVLDEYIARARATRDRTTGDLHLRKEFIERFKAIQKPV